jgi:hypothetical protein
VKSVTFHVYLRSVARINMRNLTKVVLALSLLANVGGVWWYMSQKPPVAAPSGLPPASTKQMDMDLSHFDFSKTGLSDEAGQLPPPDLTDPTEPKLPNPVGVDDITLLPK